MTAFRIVALVLVHCSSGDSMASMVDDSLSATCWLQTEAIKIEASWLKRDDVAKQANVTGLIDKAPAGKVDAQRRTQEQDISVASGIVLREWAMDIHTRTGNMEHLLVAAIALMMPAITVCCLHVGTSAPASDVLTTPRGSDVVPQGDLGSHMTSTASSVRQNAAAFMMMAGTGSYVAFYSAMAGFYQIRFQSQTFFVWMLLALYSMYPMVSLFMRSYESIFDELLGTRRTYLFRLIALPLLSVVTCATWMFCAQSTTSVLIVGCSFGVLSALSTNAAYQLVAAMAPGSLVWCEIGNLIGAFLPVLVINMLGFQPSSSMILFRVVLVPLVVLCLSTSSGLFYLEISGLFDDAYVVLSYDLPSSPVQLKKLPTATWVWIWCGCSGLMASMSFCVLSLSCFFGDASLAQVLSLSKLAAELVGGIVALVVRTKAVEMGPLHKVLFGCVVLRIGIFVADISTLGGAHIPRPVFVGSVCIFHLLFTISKPIVQTTLSVYSPRREQKVVARTNVSLLFTGVLIGILAGLIVGKLCS